MAVALTVTPALALILLRKAPVERHESPLVKRLQRGYTAGLSRIVATADERVRGLSGARRWPASWSCRNLGQSLVPDLQGTRLPDALPHHARHVGPGDGADDDPTEQGSAGHPRRAARSAPTSVRRSSARRSPGVNFGENWVSIDPRTPTTTKTIEAINAVVDKYPGVYRDVLTYLNERIEEVLTGAKEPIVVRVYGEDLQTFCGPRPSRCSTSSPASRGSSTTTSTLQVDEPQIEVEVNLAKAAKYGLKPGDVRRAAATLVAGEEVGDIFRDGKAYDTVVWSTPADTRQRDCDQRPADRHAVRCRSCSLGDVARVTVRPVPNVIERENDSRRIDVAANVSDRDLGSVVADVKNALRRRHVPTRLPRRTARRVRGAPGRAGAPLPHRDHRRPRDPAAVAGLLRQLAARVADLPHPADGACRWCAGEPHRRRRDLTRFAGRLLHRVRHRRPQRHPADQPLPAPGET